MTARQPLPKAELQALHSVLRRAIERAERNKRPDEEQIQLRAAVAALDDEMAGYR